MSWTKKQLGRKSRIQRDENRLKVFWATYQKPSTFTELLTKTKLSRASLSKHLANLVREDAVKRTLEGRKILYEANKSKTILEIRENFLNSFIRLVMEAFPALTKELQHATTEYVIKIEESIRKHEEEAETSRVLRRTIPIPKDFKKGDKIIVEEGESGKVTFVREAKKNEASGE